MNAFRLYNTLTRAVEPFEPADGRTVRMYTCGPTVYNPAHLGNFRTFLFEDLLRRVIRLRGWGVEQVMNLTDVDDKIITRAHERGISIAALTNPVIETFHRDRDYLMIERAEHYPRATEFIPQMITLVQRLMQRDLAYKAEDGSVYFAIARFPGYGKLSRLDTREVKAGARVAQDDYSKENAQDFALWKAAKPEDEKAGAAWDSPWGRGRPGWHLECSAMAMDLLGETLDIHCGGVDLIFPHHEDEIAQSEGATDKPFARVWCHGAFLLTDGAKMAKRVGNVWQIDDLRAQHLSGQAARHFVFKTHYRKELNLSNEAIESAATGSRRAGELARRLREASGGTAELGVAAAALEDEVKEALFDDLNAPEAVAALFTFVRKANSELDRNGSDRAGLERARAAFGMVDGILKIAEEPEIHSSGGADASGQQGADEAELARFVEGKIEARKAARARRAFAEADAIRKELEEQGIVLDDTPAGTRWRINR